MLASLGDNQMFGAGFGLISVGLAASAARKGFQVCKSENTKRSCSCYFLTDWHNNIPEKLYDHGGGDL